MKYAQHRSNMGKSSRKVPWKVLGGILLGLIAILVLISIFTGGDDQAVEVVEVVDQNSDLSVEVIIAEVSDDDRLGYVEIELIAVDGSGSSGVARRGRSGDLFTHVIVASLPAVDTDFHFYEGWLVKPGVVDFFSTGEMFPRDDGKWGLVWEVDSLNAPDDLDDFSQVVITLEPRDNDPAPAAHHVVEGEF